MTIAGKKIFRSEFEYSLNKGADFPQKLTDNEINEYLNLFINYRLKIQAALDARLDTLSSFKEEFRNYRDIQLRSYLYDSLYADSVAQEVYKTIKESVGDSDIVLLSHIFLSVPVNSDKTLLDKQKSRVDSIYDKLKGGADFAELAKRYSEDVNTAENGGRLPWLGPSQLIPEFRDVAYSLSPGKFSVPTLTPAGYHIIYMNDRKPFETFEEKRAELLAELNERGLREDAAEYSIRRMISQSSGRLSREDIMLKVQTKAQQENPSLKYLISEYHDGLLLYEAANRMVWQAAATDENGLEDYFQENREKYKWETPRARAYVFRVRSKEMLKRIRKILKSCKRDEGLQKLRETLPADSMKFVKVHFGIYKQGDDPIVDYSIFKTGQQPKENKLLPYYGVIGKKYKQPKNAIDVKAQVVSDYQDYCEKKWIEDLRKKYAVSVDNSVLSTVNKHD
ncbi:MAG: peptidylprolyl isomerase [Bacteroidaceae bacterium]